MMPPSTDSSASRLCGGTRRSVSSIVAITPPHRSPAGVEPRRERASLRPARVPPPATRRQAKRETFVRKLLQQPLERVAVLLREPPRLPPPGRRRLEHQEPPDHEPHRQPTRQHGERGDQRTLGRRPPPCTLLSHHPPPPRQLPIARRASSPMPNTGAVSASRNRAVGQPRRAATRPRRGSGFTIRGSPTRSSSGRSVIESV